MLVTLDSPSSPAPTAVIVISMFSTTLVPPSLNTRYTTHTRHTINISVPRMRLLLPTPFSLKTSRRNFLISILHLLFFPCIAKADTYTYTYVWCGIHLLTYNACTITYLYAWSDCPTPIMLFLNHPRLYLKAIL